MKKIFLILSAAVVLSSLAFADTSRFYEGGKVIDTMYVDSQEGLRVRDKPSLKSNRLCGLQHRLPVKVVAIGKEETIDGITAPWVEILIPRYEWKGDEAEYGWVFGGYISKERPAFVAPRNSQEIKNYLCAFPCWASGKASVFHYHFLPDGKFWCGAHEKGEITKGSYSATGKNSVYISAIFDGFGESPDRSGGLNISVINEYSFVASDSVFDYHNGATFSGYFSPMYEEDFFKQKYLYNDYGRTLYNCEYEYQKNWFESELLIELIKAGVSAEGSDYEAQYHDYWNPIMAEHQKKADAMKNPHLAEQ
ncbi:SH3 domain-containing protein [Treponema zioleckii]|uniref:SH3 domain-containing protein n=1 Tax=Treponema zioleckii TaxID=331680 RepID=UPI00168A422F|nr:SH3 domain-containing protein [Treponema zioleckii]